MICDTFKCFEDEYEIIIDLSRIKKLLEILLILLIIFTIIYFTCFGCFLVMNNSSDRVAETVTLSSEGAANKTYPDHMGVYQLGDEELEFFGGDSSFTFAAYNWYRHVDREDRFLMYSRTDFRWFITTTNNTDNVEGSIRSAISGPIINPEVEWEYFEINIQISKCTTVR